MRVEVDLRAHPQALVGQTIKKMYQITKVLGTGTFSAVYQCNSLETKDKMAIKIAISNEGDKMLNVQKRVYRQLSAKYGNRNESGFAKYYEHGKTQKFHFLVMQKLSSSIQDIFLKMSRRFSVKCVLNIGLQGVDLLQKLHEVGFVHRDVKPDNFVLPHGGRKDKIILVDFGIAHKIKTTDVSSERKKFIGTRRFASIAAHEGREIGRKDDLESLVYTLIYLMQGRLPWQGCSSRNQNDKIQKVHQMKKNAKISELAEVQYKGEVIYKGGALNKIMNYINKLEYQDVPNYKFIKNLFINDVKDLQQKGANSKSLCKDTFDWITEDDNKSQASHSSRHNSRSHSHSDRKDKRSHSGSKYRQKDRYMR